MPRTGQLYIFGDSLSDDGALAVQSEPEPIDIYFAGRASNGPVWHEYIRNDLAIAPGATSISQAPNFDGYLSGSPLNGINFAHSGAVSDSDSKPHLPGAVQQAEGFADLVASGDIPAPDDQDVFVIWIGGNDFLDLADATISDFFDILNLDTTIVDNIGQTVHTLTATGAQNFLILGQPTIGGAFLGDRAPSGSLVATLWNSLTNEFNDTLSSYVADLDSAEGVSALYVDIAAFVEDLEDDPAAFGFSNVTSDVFSDNAPLDDQSYFSVDGIHPTGAGHAAIATYVEEVARAANFDLTALAGNVLPGSARNDTLTGTGGPDTLTGQAGDDTLDGEGGHDIAVFDSAQNQFTLTLGSDIRITDRSGAEGTDVLTGIETLDFDGAVFDLTRFDDGTTLSSAAFRDLTEVYASYFNRAPDALGLLFWADALANGVPMTEIAEAFAQSDEARAAFPETAPEAAFVTTVYENTLGRAPDDDGFAFWSEALASGAVSRGKFVLAVLQGARAEPADGATQAFLDQQATDRAFLDGKVDLGVRFAAIHGLSDVTAATEVMALYDGTADSLTAAVSAADEAFSLASATDGSGQFLIELLGVVDDPFIV
ncbi:MAG: SGNH/GDSL hydrolase family protein [Marivita sp.]|uniref:DUF4214 domain-containing protein n=1 Tax=Marivita sp. TaxID=2003365 RepID=UPI0025BF5472|nr:SGNH/GDSL hydrolase family protein [Marivita sp.]MCI5112941.1 SGNH/GDSL hydrolase family protein [Marivita sp.]